MSTLVLRYKRLHEKIGNEYPYQGVIVWNGVEKRFDRMFFRGIIGELHNILKEAPLETRVIFQRTDREGIVPFELGEHTIRLIRRDPVLAYKKMNFNSEPTVQVTGSGEGAAFGRYVYLRVENGMIEDPLTGHWKTFAYGPEKGWMIRDDETNDHTRWLPLVSLIDSAPEGATNLERLAFTRWALLDVEQLLCRMDATRFYVPRPWNSHGPWISREELLKLYEKSKEHMV